MQSLHQTAKCEFKLCKYRLYCKIFNAELLIMAFLGYQSQKEQFGGLNQLMNYIKLIKITKWKKKIHKKNLNMESESSRLIRVNRFHTVIIFSWLPLNDTATKPAVCYLQRSNNYKDMFMLPPAATTFFPSFSSQFSEKNIVITSFFLILLNTIGIAYFH